MTKETETITTDSTTGGQVVYTPADARIESLQKQMDEMKAQYDQQLKSYQDANKQLFAMLNRPSVGEVETVSEEPAVAGFDVDKAEQAFMKRYTRSE